MTFAQAIDAFIVDMRAEGRINSPHSELAYRTKLVWLLDVVTNRDPSKVGKGDLKVALARWEGNSRRHAHAVYTSFFEWTVYESIRDTNPARMIRPTRRREPVTHKLTRAEAIAVLETSKSRARDRWFAHLGMCAGLRSQELRGITGRHFARQGWIWVDRSIGKGGRERWIPVIADLQDVVEEIRSERAADELVLPGRGGNVASPGTLYKQALALGERAGVPARMTPHSLRHAFAENVAKAAGLRVAQSLLGHSSVETTTLYTEAPSLDEIAISVQGFSFWTVPMMEREHAS